MELILILPLPTARRAISRRRQELLEFRASSSNAAWARCAAWLSAGGSRTQSGGKCRGGGDGIAEKEGKESSVSACYVISHITVDHDVDQRADTCRQRKNGPGQCVCLLCSASSPAETKPNLDSRGCQIPRRRQHCETYKL